MRRLFNTTIMKFKLTIILTIPIISCTPEMHVAPADSYHYSENIVVKFNGAKLTKKSGTYHQNSANKWISIGNAESKIRIQDHKPRFVIKHENNFNLILIRLVREDSIRYSYFWPNPIEMHWKTVSPGTTEITFDKPLPCGEYAFWKVRGVDGMPPDPNAQYQYQGGVFWDFGIDD